MREHKKYTDIIRLGHKESQGVLNVGDKITITEKIDGANASFCKTDEGVDCYSRNQRLDGVDTLRGFHGWVIENILPKRDSLIHNYRFYGEWLCPHKVVYKKDAQYKFYLFSIYDELLQLYLSDEIVKEYAIELGLQTPEYFYEGEYVSFEHLQQFVGKSNLTEIPNTGEGIVVKNVDFINRYGNQVFVKLVSSEFAEIQKQKLAKDPSSFDGLNLIVSSVINDARVDKMIRKCIDNGLLSDSIGIEDMGLLLKTLAPLLIEDIYKEESEMFGGLEFDNVKKSVGKVLPVVVKSVLKNF